MHHPLIPPGILTRRANILPFADRSPGRQTHAPIGDFAVFLHQHRIRPGGYRRTGKDACHLPGHQGTRRITGSNPQRHGQGQARLIQIRIAQGHAIHGGIIEGGHIHAGHHVLGQVLATGITECDLLHPGKGRSAVQQSGQGLLHRHQTHRPSPSVIVILTGESGRQNCRADGGHPAGRE